MCARCAVGVAELVAKEDAECLHGSEQGRLIRRSKEERESRLVSLVASDWLEHLTQQGGE